MKLTDLEPQFVRYEKKPCYVGAPDCNTVSEHTEHEVYVFVDTLAEADGLWYLCPKCFATSIEGSVGVHSILSWRVGRVKDDVTPGPGRWNFLGTDYGDLTFQAGSSSIALNGKGCGAHFFIENGLIRMA